MNSTALIPLALHLRRARDPVIRRNYHDPNEEHHTDMQCKILLMILLLAGTAAAADLLMVSQVPSNVSPAVQEAIKNAVSILDDGRLRIACILGSCGGGIVSSIFFPFGTAKLFASRIIGSIICGVMFSPKILSWFSWDTTTDNVICMSGMVALLSWTVIQFFMPLIPPMLGKLFNRWFTDKTKTDP
jgi:hypothetical protein